MEFNTAEMEAMTDLTNANGGCAAYEAGELEPEMVAALISLAGKGLLTAETRGGNLIVVLDVEKYLAL